MLKNKLLLQCLWMITVPHGSSHAWSHLFHFLCSSVPDTVISKLSLGFETHRWWSAKQMCRWDTSLFWQPVLSDSSESFPFSELSHTEGASIIIHEWVRKTFQTCKCCHTCVAHCVSGQSILSPTGTLTASNTLQQCRAAARVICLMLNIKKKKKKCST